MTFLFLSHGLRHKDGLGRKGEEKALNPVVFNRNSKKDRALKNKTKQEGG